jgi:thermitase
MKNEGLSRNFGEGIHSTLVRFGRLLCWAAAIAVAGFNMASAQNTVPNRILIKPKASVAETTLKSLWSSYSINEHHRLPQQGVRVMAVAPGQRDAVLQLLRRNANIEYAEPDYIATPCLTPNDPYYSQQWHLPNIQAPGAWNVTTGTTNVILAVVDSGVDLAHPDLAGRLLPGTNLVTNTTDPSDDNGHGTAVTGTAAATGNNGIGVAGVNWNCLILPVKVADATGSATYSAVAQGINYAADHGARVINISLGGPSSSSTLQSAIDYAWSKGVVIVAAAGNNGNSQPSYPGACNHVVAVSALQSNDTLASWSSYGSFISLSAPGVGIWTCNTNESYASWSGTSFSSPIVAGVASLVASINPALSNTQIVSVLESTARHLGSSGYKIYYGYGLVNASNAVFVANGGVPPIPSVPTVAITSPVGGSVVSGTVNIAVTASETGGVIAQTACYVDGKLIGVSTSSSPVFAWNSATVVDGAHVLQACAYDATGNVGNSATVTVTTNNGVSHPAPTVVISSPANGSTVQGTISIVVSATDSIRVAWVDCYLDGRRIGLSSGSSATFTVNTTSLPNGTHILQAQACDVGGNLGSSATVSINVQNVPSTTPPTVVITSPAGGTNVHGYISIAVSATDALGVSRTECYVDNELIGVHRGGTTTFFFDTTLVVDGTHTLQARAYDPSGNVGISASISVTVQNITGGPTVTITSPADGSTLASRSQPITVTSSETGRRIVEVDLYVDGWFWDWSGRANPVFTLDTRWLASGAHTLEAVAWDEHWQTGASTVITVQK